MPRPIKPKPAPRPVGRPPKKVRKNPVGRPLLLTKQVAEQVAKVLRGGSTLDYAAAVIGVHKKTLENWLEKGAEARQKEPPWTPEEELYIVFWEKVNLAIHTAERRLIENIQTAATFEWKAAHALLQTHPLFKDAWAKYDEKLITHQGKVEHQHAHGHVVLTQDDLDNMSLEDKRRLREAIRLKKEGAKEPTPVKGITHEAPSEPPPVENGALPSITPPRALHLPPPPPTESPPE